MKRIKRCGASEEIYGLRGGERQNSFAPAYKVSTYLKEAKELYHH
jgi:hypothetical protein